MTKKIFFISFAFILIGSCLITGALAKANNQNDDIKVRPYLTHATSTPPIIKPQETATSTLACVKTAVIKREAAVVTAIDTYQTALKAALTTRGTALAAAWDITVNKDRLTAINTAWKNFRATNKEALKIKRTAILNVWKTFKTERKACIPAGSRNVSGDDSMGQGTDLAL